MTQKGFLCSGAAGELDDEIDVIGLYFGFVGSFIAADLSAFIAFMNDDITFFGVRLRFDRTQDATAGIGAVAGVDIYVERAKTARTMVAGAVSERLDFKSAVFADKGIVVFGESFLFHSALRLRLFMLMITQNAFFVKCEGYKKHKPLSVEPKGEMRFAICYFLKPNPKQRR